MSNARLPLEHASGPRWIGRLRVLDTIRLHGPIARIDISHVTGLSPATVTAITAELIEIGMIEPNPAVPKDKDAKRGRPRATLKLRAQAAVVAGLKVGTEAITVMLTDFIGTQIGHVEHPLPAAQFSAQELCRQITTALSSACRANVLDPDDLAGAVVGLAGYIDGAEGYVHWSSALTERSIDLTAILQDMAPCPVFIENDVNLVAKAEHLFGLGKHSDNFLVVTIEHGIGLGIVLGGTLHRGARGCGAEFGHTKVTPDGPLCQCGQTGCLEAYAGEYALIARANEASIDQDYDTFGAFLQAAKSSDPAATRVLAQAQKFFAMGLANLVNLFDPQQIIVASKIGSLHPLCASEVLDQVAGMVVQLDRPMPEIQIHGWGDLMWARGAAAQALEEVTVHRLKAL